MERETLEVDVLVVGAGPAGLSAALHLANLQRSADTAPEATILVLEKGREIGSHALSGAVVDPRPFRELLDEASLARLPFGCPVEEESLLWLKPRRTLRVPVMPVPLRNHGCFVTPLGDLVRSLATLCEEAGVEVYPGFAAVDLIWEGERVAGVITGDSGIGRDGRPKPNYQPGIEVRAKVTLLAEGPRGTLTGIAARRLKLERAPQIYAVGVKELWQTDNKTVPGRVIHTLGYPLDSREFGGGFFYTMKDGLVAAGLVVGLDSPSPRMDPHQLLQQWKAHPAIRDQLAGGRLLSYGAKAIPEGGYYAIPRLHGDGLLLLGDSAGLLNSQRLKGIHLAVKSGMLAAETVFELIEDQDFSASSLSRYGDRFRESWAGEELYRVRNFRQAFQGGLTRGFLHTALQFVTGGRGLRDPLPIRPGHECMEKGTTGVPVDQFVPDGTLTFDRLTSVYHSDTSHEEDQPSHLKILDSSICDHRCGDEFGHPCIHFCPANVYEILAEAVENKLRINFSNCVHCKTCEIADPYQVIRWTPPEGGGGPDWKRM